MDTYTQRNGSQCRPTNNRKAIDNCPSTICTCYAQWEQEQNKANARLIAAAPEMLEALEACKKELEHWAYERYSDVECWPAYQKVVAVIKKAKGE